MSQLNTTTPVEGDEQFDPAWNLLLTPGYGHLYHTRLAPDAEAHKTRESLSYATRLLASGDQSRYARAADVIRAVLKVQDIEPTSKTFGLWPWYGEEPLPQMSLPDYNWAEFCGLILDEILILYSDRLPIELVTEMREALHRACLCIFRRNMGPGYTNISLLGGVAMAAAGEVLEDRCWLDYGRQRLADLLAVTQRFEGFKEFNSPTYTMVVVEGCETLLRIVRDPACLETGNTLLRLAWEQIADSYHPPTGQWTGAQSRSYHTRLAQDTSQILANRTDVELRGEDGAPIKPRPDHEAVPCPPDLVHHFAQPPAQPYTARRRVNRAVNLLDGVDIVTTNWMDDRRTLGSVSGFTTGPQARHLYGYWLVDEAVAHCRMRVLKDGKDFASSWLWNAQTDRHVLTSLSFCSGFGAWIGYADRPEGGVHQLEDLRLRIEIVGPGATAEADNEGFVLRCGEQRLVVRPAESQFAGKTVPWEISQDDEHAWVDAVLHTGEPLDFNPAKHGETVLAVGCSMVNDTESAPTDAPTVGEVTAERRDWSWAGHDLTLTTARQAVHMPGIWR